ncbi:hypothetical protein [Asanoa siamensis]|uniref:Uncharacterized protein n=1 Tax=Asanoa siamensis TaxID=926357 RepID=A0ABQ4CWS9_9ACTN|nr:hypothetical protein [Asanoa siamensis]GIF75751.1 hypothetical protein Asi02nite_52690 [Asanoa siamensis]
MGRPLKVIIAVLLIVVGLVGCTAFLTGQGLDRAEKWVSISGTVISVVVGVYGLVLAWQIGSRSGGSQRPGRTRVARTGNAQAHGAGSRANTGLTGRVVADSTTVLGTGDATATQGGSANTGEDHSR